MKLLHENTSENEKIGEKGKLASEKLTKKPDFQWKQLKISLFTAFYARLNYGSKFYKFV